MLAHTPDSHFVLVLGSLFQCGVQSLADLLLVLSRCAVNIILSPLYKETSLNPKILLHVVEVGPLPLLAPFEACS